VIEFFYTRTAKQWLAFVAWLLALVLLLVVDVLKWWEFSVYVLMFFAAATFGYLRIIR
jgi:hypothetical protein